MITNIRSSPNPKSQSRSLKKQLRAGSSVCQKSKSLQKKSFTPYNILSSLMFARTAGSNHQIVDIDNITIQKTKTDKQKRKKQMKQYQKQGKKKPLTAGSKRVKNFIGNKLQKRLQSYYLFLVLARQILKAPIARPLGQNRKYTVYIGKGNNSKLVKSLFYSRHWWNVTNDPKSQNINLIWTQWSKKSIFQQIPQNQQQKQKDKIINKIICSPQNKKTQIFNQFNYLLRKQQRDSTKGTFIQTQTDVKNYLNSTKQIRNKNILTITCNHVQGHDTITDKKNLFYSLKQYCEEKKQNCFDILPLTFHITGTQQQFIKLQQIQKILNQQDKRIMWITKPGEKSNRGNGIKVFKKIIEIKDYLQQQGEKHPNRTYIVQKYIYPALFHRRKFDIRCFVLLIVSTQISAYFYNDGYLRTSSKQFKDKKYDDKFIHLTNDAIQKKGNDYGKYQKGNKITFEEYQKFIDMFEKKKQINFKQQIFPKLKLFAAKSIAAGCNKFNQSNKLYSFQILGYDFMLDQQYKPWLIQVNTNPCLQTGCPVLDQFIPSAVNNVIKLAVDSVFRPPKVNNWHLQEVITFSEKILEQNKFQLIFQQKIQ